MKELEQFIINNIKLKNGVEYELLTFRTIYRSATIVHYLENMVIRDKPIFHPIFVDEMRHILGNYIVLAMHYLPNNTYSALEKTIIFNNESTISSLKIKPAISLLNNIVSNSSEIINMLSSDKENEFYVSQLVTEGLKLCYSLCEILNIDMEDLRERILEDKDEILLTTTQAIERKEKIELDKHILVDLIIDKGEYKGLKVVSNLVEDDPIYSGDIIKDFFVCTKSLRDKKQKYKYSSQLFEYFLNNQDITQAYIFNGTLQKEADIKPERLEYLSKHINEFEKDYHHIIVKSSINTMDDFLDYIYSTEK